MTELIKSGKLNMKKTLKKKREFEEKQKVFDSYK